MIEKGRVAIWRGSDRHAGASYEVYNSRLHVAVCNRDEVYNIVESKTYYINFKFKKIESKLKSNKTQIEITI